MDSIWTIIILTVNGREKYYSNLRSTLDPQISNKPIQTIVLKDNKEKSIGLKRQIGLDLTTTKYISFIDDDDMISYNFCDSILYELDKDVDGVGFRGIMHNTNSKFVHEFVLKNGLRYSEKPEKYGGGYVYTRPLNHLNPVRLDIAKQIGFSDKSLYEDAEYSIRLNESKLIVKDSFIDEYLYFYQYRHNKKI